MLKLVRCNDSDAITHDRLRMSGDFNTVLNTDLESNYHNNDFGYH